MWPLGLVGAIIVVALVVLWWTRSARAGGAAIAEEPAALSAPTQQPAVTTPALTAVTTSAPAKTTSVAASSSAPAKTTSVSTNLGPASSNAQSSNAQPSTAQSNPFAVLSAEKARSPLPATYASLTVLEAMLDRGEARAVLEETDRILGYVGQPPQRWPSICAQWPVDADAAQLVSLESAKRREDGALELSIRKGSIPLRSFGLAGLRDVLILRGKALTICAERVELRFNGLTQQSAADYIVIETVLPNDLDLLALSTQPMLLFDASLAADILTRVLGVNPKHNLALSIVRFGHNAYRNMPAQHPARRAWDAAFGHIR